MYKSPYKFLDSYSKEDRDIFFGRDKEIDELYSRVFESKILIIYGTSGTGKSSLINCGLANKFNDSDWLPVTVRRGTDINRSFNESLERVALNDYSSGRKATTGNKSGDILKIIRSIYLDHFKPLFLIFDQFEELFIFGNNREKEELIENVRQVIDSELQCRFIFSVREEYLAGLTDFEKVIPSFLSNRVRIEKMTRQNAIQVIDGPCRFNGIKVESGFAEMVLDKLNQGSAEIELTWLQVYLDNLFRIGSRNGENISGLTKGLIERTGDVKDLLGAFLEEQISRLDDPELGMVVLKSFVSVKGTKQQITGDEVIGYSKSLGKNIDGGKIRELIQEFIRLRILRDKDENGRYELRHDSLATKIYEEITMVEKELLEIRLFLENSFNNYEKRHLFLSEEDLKYIAPYEEKLFLNDRITKFISQSKREIHKVRRRRQNILATAAVILISILSFFTFWALRERNKAVEQQQLAETRKSLAERARTTADSATIEAEKSKDLAVARESQAVLAQMQSDEARKTALSEREYAMKQKVRADNFSITASEEARKAREEKIKADSARIKAVLAESDARRLGLLSTAQNLALKSSGMEKDPQLMGLLAVQAYNFNKNNNGEPEDPIIYEALNKAYSVLDNSRHSVLTGSVNEIRILRGTDDGSLLSADLDGHIIKWNKDGGIKDKFTLPVKSPVNFIGASLTGNEIITQHDNLDLYLWDLKSLGKEGSVFQLPDSHKDFVHCIAFTADDVILATAGRDSSLGIWDIKGQAPLGTDPVRTGSGIRAIVFSGKASLIIAQDDGSIVQWDIIPDSINTIMPAGKEKPLSLTWNDNDKVLIAGCTDGDLLLFKMVDGNFLQPSHYRVHDSGIDLLAFNSDYSLLATSSWDKTIRYYNYEEFFELGNSIGGGEHIRNLNSRVRSLVFTDNNRLVAGLSDKSIRIWETSSEKLASLICNLLTREMTVNEWNEKVGHEIPYEKTRAGGATQ